MPTIETAGALIPGTIDTPLDVRSRVAALTDVADIANPVLGGIFYCVATGRHYKITALKSKVIGALTVANAGIDSYEELCPAASANEAVRTLILSRPAVDDPLYLKLYVSGTGTTANMTSVADTTTAAGRALVKVYAVSEGTGAWEPFPADGLTVDYAGAPVKIDLFGVSGLPGYIFYRWETANGSDRDYASMFFPSSVAAAPSGGFSDADGTDGHTPTIGANGHWFINGVDTGKAATGVGGNVVLSPTPPAEPYDGMIWCRVENAADAAYINVNALTVVESSAAPVDPADGTIWVPAQSD